MSDVSIYICILTANSEIQDIYRYFASAACESANAVKIFNTVKYFFSYRSDYNSKI